MIEHMLRAILYLLSGGLLWRETVIPGPRDPHNDLDRVQLAVWQYEKEPAFLLVKATFMLAWPLALLYGLIVARYPD